MLRREDRPDGGVLVTVEVQCRRAYRLLTGRATREHTFGLDKYGREVLDACNGARRVKDIIRRFADAHKISAAEAELSVTAFLRTLLTKGLIVMDVPHARRRLATER
jgi:hypothetical protein